MEKQVLTADEINELKDLQKQLNDIQILVGETEIQIMNLQIRKDQIKEKFKVLQQEEYVLAKKLEDKYGNGTISIESGEFLPNK